MIPKRMKAVHLIGIGGVNMSGVAKLLRRAGVSVSGSDTTASELTHELEELGIQVFIGHDADNVPPDCDLIIYSSAVPELNPERAEGRRRNLPQMTNFAFLGEWTKDKRVLLVSGTHGKSTTTAMLGFMLELSHYDPTVIVGSRLSSFPDGNVRFGESDLDVIEGDEYARHFLEFQPYGLIINNIEPDHFDIFPDLDAVMNAFRTLLSQIQSKGIVIANADDQNVQTLIGQERAELEARGISIQTFGFGSHADQQVAEYAIRGGEQVFTLRNTRGLMTRFRLQVPGKMNIMNATGALTLCQALGVPSTVLQDAVEAFPGIWRRFETVAEQDDIMVISDYGHHPTAIAATLEAAKDFYPGKRLILAFQPHHRNRTKHLFEKFVESFDKADALILVEIYDVAGRDNKDDEKISSRDLQDAVLKRDLERTISRPIEYAADPDAALEILRRWKRRGDVILVMGAGDIYKIANSVLK